MKPGAAALAPFFTSHASLRQQGSVEGAVHFDGIEFRRIVGQIVGGFHSFRVECASPSRSGECGGPYTNSEMHTHELLWKKGKPLLGGDEYADANCSSLAIVVGGVGKT